MKIGVGKGGVWDGGAWTIYNHGDTSIAMRSERDDWVDIKREEFHALVSQGKITQPIQKGHAHIGGVTYQKMAILAKANKQDYREGNERHKTLQRYCAGKTPGEEGAPYRTLCDWDAKDEEAR